MNRDEAVVAGFGDEWSRFDQSELPDEDRRRAFAAYFSVFPWQALPPDAVGMDIGCGSGRWAALAADRVGTLICVDASAEALEVARRNLQGHDNCNLILASVDGLPVEPASMDFAYSLGVLHHVPDTAAAIKSCAEILKPGAPLLLYLYYSFENRPLWFRGIWRASDLVRRGVSHSPFPVRNGIANVMAAGVYWPLARASAVAERLGRKVDSLPLSIYRNMSFYVMRTDARDRFGTQLESRFSRAQITDMMSAAGLTGITFSDEMPHWCVVGFKGESR